MACTWFLPNKTAAGPCAGHHSALYYGQWPAAQQHLRPAGRPRRPRVGGHPQHRAWPPGSPPSSISATLKLNALSASTCQCAGRRCGRHHLGRHRGPGPVLIARPAAAGNTSTKPAGPCPTTTSRPYCRCPRPWPAPCCWCSPKAWACSMPATWPRPSPRPTTSWRGAPCPPWRWPPAWPG